jgi:hypothetical protein
MPTIDATVGGASSNSYATLVEADAYFEDRIGYEDWPSYSDGRQESALILATQILEEERYIGQKLNLDTQALLWPRYNVVDSQGRWYPTDAIPQKVKDAECELAFSILDKTFSSPTASTSPTQGGLSRIERISIAGEIDMEIRAGGDMLPPIVVSLLREFRLPGAMVIRG